MILNKLWELLHQSPSYATAAPTRHNRSRWLDCMRRRITFLSEFGTNMYKRDVIVELSSLRDIVDASSIACKAVTRNRRFIENTSEFSFWKL